MTPHRDITRVSARCGALIKRGDMKIPDTVRWWLGAIVYHKVSGTKGIVTGVVLRQHGVIYEVACEDDEDRTWYELEVTDAPYQVTGSGDTEV